MRGPSGRRVGARASESLSLGVFPAGDAPPSQYVPNTECSSSWMLRSGLSANKSK